MNGYFTAEHRVELAEYAQRLADGTLHAEWKDDIWDARLVEDADVEPVVEKEKLKYVSYGVTTSCLQDMLSDLLHGLSTLLQLFLSELVTYWRTSAFLTLRRSEKMFSCEPFALFGDFFATYQFFLQIQFIHPRTLAITVLLPSSTAVSLPASYLVVDPSSGPPARERLLRL